MIGVLSFDLILYRLKLKDHRVAFSHRPEAKVPARPTAAARSLALGYRILQAILQAIQQAIQQGEVRDTAEAARRMGVAQERVSSVVGLTFLAPRIQERILGQALKLKGGTVRTLIRIARLAEWRDQERLFQESGGAREGLGQNVSEG